MKCFTPFLLALLILTTGCASICGRPEHRVEVNSVPDHATITIRDEMGNLVYAGETPAKVVLQKKKAYFSGKDYWVTFTKPGFTDRTFKMRRTVSGWYALGNLVVGGLIGYLVVDPYSGKMWTLDPKLTIYLEKKELPSEGAPNAKPENGELKVSLLSEIPETLRDQLVPLS